HARRPAVAARVGQGRRASLGRAGRVRRCKPRDLPRELDLPDVDGLGPLVSLLLLVGDFRPLGERAVTVTGYPGVVNEEVTVSLVRGDEPEPLVVAEPLDSSRGHMSSVACVLRTRRILLSNDPASACTTLPSTARPDAG